MFCENCGKELKDGWKICPYCGHHTEERDNTDGYSQQQQASAIESENLKQRNQTPPVQHTKQEKSSDMSLQQKPPERTNGNKKKSKKWLWIVIPLCIVAVVFGILIVQEVLRQQNSDKYIDMVKNAEIDPEAYPDLTYEEALEKYFDSPTWDYERTSAKANVVNFSGNSENEKQEKIKYEFRFLCMDEEPPALMVVNKDGEMMEDAEEEALLDSICALCVPENKEERVTEQPAEATAAPEPTPDASQEPDIGAEAIDGVKRHVAPGMGVNVDKLMYDLVGPDLEWSYEKTDAEYVTVKYRDKARNAECKVVFLAERGTYTYTLPSENDAIEHVDYNASLYDARVNDVFDQELYDTINYEILGVTPEEAAGSGDYILPDSNTRRLTTSDLAGLTKQQLRLARNEIYARHGRKFQDPEMQAYFNSKSWYRGTVDSNIFSENVLNQIEKDNIALIQSLE